MNFRTRLGIGVLAAALTATLAPGAATVRAAATDPLVTDGLAALNDLVSSTNCSEKDAADDNTDNGVELGFRLCDDGTSTAGSKGIPVPAAYHPTPTGNDYSGLPQPASEEEVAAADAKYDLRPDDARRITLDVDVSLPTKPAPAAGYPLMVFMHGCCGGNRKSWESPTIDGANELWHNSNAYFAARGYVVLNYPARGFRNSNDQGSTGTTQLDSRRFEINDFQYLVGLMVDDDEEKRADGEDPTFDIDPSRIGVNGGSYGGGFAWMALTDPTWKSPALAVRLKLGAVVTKYGWTDLVEALLPGGHYHDRSPTDLKKTAIAPTDPQEALSLHPIGVEKQSTVTGLYATGENQADNHTTFPDYMDSTYQRLQQGEPYDGDPAVEQTADWFIQDRSAYFQVRFWQRVKRGLRIPVYAAATWTDPLFPTMETVRFLNKLERVAPDYPIKVYVGDYQHLYAQNKAKEWDSLCGEDHHVCTVDDFRDDDERIRLKSAQDQVRAGALARIDRFLQYYLQGKGKTPTANITATTTICSSNATDELPKDEPGVEYRAPSWRALAPRNISFEWDAGGTITNGAADVNAVESDPVARNRQAEKCFITDQKNPPVGVVTLSSEPLDRTITMMGIPLLELEYETTDSDYWIAARVYDEDPDGVMTLVTRGICRHNEGSDAAVGCERISLWGNGWRFSKDHRVIVELTQSDTPTFRKDNFVSSIEVGTVKLDLPRTKPVLQRDFRS
jgi:predicted acyl esterase